jgi:hypothetical protein
MANRDRMRLDMRLGAELRAICRAHRLGNTPSRLLLCALARGAPLEVSECDRTHSI